MEDAPYEVAIVGGGIVGVTLAAGLVRRNIKVKLFEQARNFTEIGVGIGFSPNTIRCMQLINPDVVTSLHEGGAVPMYGFRYLDGVSQPTPDDPDYQKRLCHLDTGDTPWQTVRRDMFLLELVRNLPAEIFRLNSRLAHVQQEGPDGKVILTFADGFSYTADAMIACDGLKSKTRQIMLGPEDPASYPQYTHKCAYRTLLPIEKVREAVGEYKTKHLHIHLGPGAHVMHYPVNSKMIGSAVYVHDPNDWPPDTPLTAWGVREDVLQAVQGWSEPIRRLVEHFPEKLEKWALFDMYEYPLKQYNFDRIALAGDAAHASSPHHGAGASFGVEDCLCLCTLLDETTEAITSKHWDKNKALQAAFQTFDEIRRTRTQWLVNSSRRTCDFYQQEEWGDAIKRVKAETCFEEVKDRSFKVWNFNPAGMIINTIEAYAKRLHDGGNDLEHIFEASATRKQVPADTNHHDIALESLTTTDNRAVYDPSQVNGAERTRLSQRGDYTPSPPKIDWLVKIPDHKDVLPKRIANIQSHMSNSRKRLAEDVLVMAGPSLSDADGKEPSMTGSVQVIKASNRKEVFNILSEDPFAKLGVWDLDKATLQPMRVGVLKSPSGA